MRFINPLLPEFYFSSLLPEFYFSSSPKIGSLRLPHRNFLMSPSKIKIEILTIRTLLCVLGTKGLICFFVTCFLCCIVCPTIAPLLNGLTIFDQHDHIYWHFLCITITTTKHNKKTRGYALEDLYLKIISEPFKFSLN